MSTNQLDTMGALDRLQVYISQAKAIPLSNRVMVVRDDLLALFNELRSSIPNDVQKAQQLLEAEDRIITDSHRKADATIQDANQRAKNTIESANNQAASTLNDAQARAEETISSASNQANAMLADAQNRASTIVADAQVQAQKLVSESEILLRAQNEAQELMNRTHQTCDQFSKQVQDNVQDMLEHADCAISQQLDALRALRQEISGNYDGAH